MSEKTQCAAPKTNESARATIRALFLLSILEGLPAIYSLVRIPSEAKNAVLWGLSKSRLLALLGYLLILAALTVGWVFWEKRKVLTGKPANAWRAIWLTRGFIALMTTLFSLFAGFFFLNALNVRELATFVPSLVERFGGGMLWGMLLCGQLSAIVLLWLRQSQAIPVKIFDLPFIAILFLCVSIVFFFGFRYFDRLDWNRNLRNSGWVTLAPAIVVTLWLLLRLALQSTSASVRACAQADQVLLCLFIGALIFSIYRITGYLMFRVNNPAKSYWDLLAEAFLQRRLYLINPPTTHDLTLHNGNWYVPNPPLPAILLMPFVAWLGVANINMTAVSAILGALNGMMVFLILQKASQKGLTGASLSTNLWVTVIFAFSTNHYWLATIGQMWFVSQLTTVFFAGCAIYAALSGWNGVFSGLFLGLAMLARPNVFPLAFFLLGIVFWQQNAEFPRIDWKRTLRWAISFAVPAALCAFALFWYNEVRFASWTDFGYVTINGAPWIMEAVQQYGMFNPHFIATNLRTMFWTLPRIDLSGERYFFQPGVAGYSIFAMTPALVTVFRSFRKNWWVIGAWCSVILTTALLMLYHNTGAEQVGFRYLMDCIHPLLLLMALGIGKKPGKWVKGLTLAGIVINYVSIYWWYLGRI